MRKLAKRRLILVTGFPRTGTTWLQRTLLRSPDVAGHAAELGWMRLWGCRDSLVTDVEQSFAPLFAAQQSGLPLSPAFLWGGFYGGQAIARDCVGCFDAQALLACRRNPSAACVLEKTPHLGPWPCGWPDEYLAQSVVFQNASLVVCRRDCEGCWQSVLRHYGPAIARQFPQSAFEQYYQDFYAVATARENVVWCDHAEAAADPDSVARRVCKQIGVACAGADVWHLTPGG